MKRVVIVGDSLVVMAEDQLTATFTANGVEVTYIAVSGTGILTDQGVAPHRAAGGPRGSSTPTP